MSVQETSIAGKNRSFAPTRWTLILRAKGENAVTATGASRVRRDALNDLITIYWRPLYCYLRRQGHKVEDAKDLAQSFFTSFLEKDFLKAVNRGKGRFRTFLLVALQHFLSNDYDKGRALKRGGGRRIVSLDFDDAELNYAREPHTDETAERLYLRKWARALTSEAMLALEQDFARRNKAGIFKAIKPYLAGGDDYEKLAGSIQLTVSNAKVTVHRARKRYGELLRAAVRDTVQADSDVDAELRELMDSL